MPIPPPPPTPPTGVGDPAPPTGAIFEVPPTAGAPTVPPVETSTSGAPTAPTTRTTTVPYAGTPTVPDAGAPTVPITSSALGAGTPTVPHSTSSFRPIKPTMGGLHQIKENEWCPWTGGKPRPDWSGLDPVALPELKDPDQLRPLGAYAQKSQLLRVEGFTKKFGRTQSLPEFQKKLLPHLVSHGLDTISYVNDSNESSQMLCIITDWNKMDLKAAKQTAATLHESKYDSYDRKNSENAAKFLLNSVEESLQLDITRFHNESDGFVVLFIEFIRTLIKNSFDRTQRLETELKAVSISQYPRQNCSAMADRYLAIADQLSALNSYDHHYTLIMVESFGAAGGSVDYTPTLKYRLLLEDLEKQLKVAFDVIRFLDINAANDHMNSKSLDYRSVLAEIITQYESLVATGRWAPASTPLDKSAPKFRTNLVSSTELQDQGTEFAAGFSSAMALIQNSKPGVKRCFGCGSPDHFLPDCPNKGQARSGPHKSSNNRKPSTKPGSGSPYFRTPDASWCKSIETIDGTTHWTSTIKGKPMHFCAKCRRWTTTHWTATHTKKSPSSQSSGRPPNTRPPASASRPAGTYFAAATNPGAFSFFSLNVGSTGLLPTLPATKKAYFGLLFRSFSWVLPYAVAFMFLHAVTIYSFGSPLAVSSAGTPTVLIIPPMVSRLFSFFGLTLPWVLLLAVLWIGPSDVAHYSYDTPPPNWPRPMRRFANRSYQREIRRSYRKPPAPSRPPFRHKYCASCTLLRSHKSPEGENWRSKQSCQPQPTSPPDPGRHHVNYSYSTGKKSRGPNRRRQGRRSTVTGEDWWKRRNRTRKRQHQAFIQRQEQKARLAEKLQRREHDRMMRAMEDWTWTQPPSAASDQQQSLFYNITLAGIRAIFSSAVTEHLVKTKPSANAFPVVWDSGASVCVTMDKSDFVGPLEPPPHTRTEGITSEVKVEGQGHIAYAIPSQNGMYRTVKARAVLIPEARARLLSIPALLQAYPNEELVGNYQGLGLSGCSTGPYKTEPLFAPFDPQNNLPISYAYKVEDTVSTEPTDWFSFWRRGDRNGGPPSGSNGGSPGSMAVPVAATLVLKAVPAAATLVLMAVPPLPVLMAVPILLPTNIMTAHLTPHYHLPWQLQ